MVTFGDDEKGHIIGIDKIQITPHTCLENVLYVLGLKHNLINRQGNIYMIDLNDITSTNHCLIADNAQPNKLS